MENLNRTVSEKLNLNQVNDVVNTKVKDINGLLSGKLDSLNQKINGMNLSFNGKVNDEKVKSVADKSVNYLKVGLDFFQNLISKFCSFVLTAPVLGLLAAVFAVPLFICLVIFIILSPILVPWLIITLGIALVTFLIAASVFLLKVFLVGTVGYIVVKTIMKLTGSKKERDADGAASGGITVDKVVQSLTESAKEYVEFVKTASTKSVEYSKTGYNKSVTTVKDFVEKRKNGGAAAKKEDEKPENNKAEPEGEKPEEEKKNE
ncbi:hypothetical protein BCR32DRAFT_294943 [Anaeromyces robustus]|jgi:hypothetical protein|uniref:Uncharacterized protein n=1 Tax=Anaeromyces robustus TaxID=1754192 RepID=A0A1Y1WZ36_9FUNG|nr:hypothetical protein BCR32DRAFT_294943 [Anaeromyces robustus]|eukprot:ORX78608.1 hypothetical protein BCR32DRAFT_294943 [Anaeromyces robustus]